MTFLFLDTETTGLEDHHQVWEIGFAELTGPVRSFFVAHTLVGADEKALEVTNYRERGVANPFLWDQKEEFRLFNMITPDTTIIAANPSFDRDKLKARWGVFPAHYRLLDIETWATAQIDNRRAPMGMSGIYKYFSEELGNPDIPAPDHTAGEDVRTMRWIYNYFAPQVAE
jgi:hypothetical protein